jgi:hypothetical protein
MGVAACIAMEDTYRDSYGDSYGGSNGDSNGIARGVATEIAMGIAIRMCMGIAMCAPAPNRKPLSWRCTLHLERQHLWFLRFPICTCLLAR